VEKDPQFVAAYDALEEEFALASALIKARGDADMTQEQVAEAMGTTQAVVAGLGEKQWGEKQDRPAFPILCFS